MYDSTLLQVLREQLKDSSPTERQYALDRVSDLAPLDAVNLIIPLLQDKDENVCIEAIACLRDLRDPAAITYLIDIVETTLSQRCQENALAALSGFTGPEVRSCLLRTLTSLQTSNIARMKIAIQLWRYVDEEVIEVLKDLVLNDNDRNVRSHAADSLELLFRVLKCPPEWTSFWNKVFEDPEIGVSGFAQKALAMLRKVGIKNLNESDGK